MSTNIVSEKKVTFKEIEKTIFERICEAGREATCEILQTIDEAIAEKRDKAIYRDKGYRKTTIKTIYGEVEYKRHVYIKKDEEGQSVAVYLLDQELGMDTIGFISTNLAEKILTMVTNTPFRKTARHFQRNGKRKYNRDMTHLR